MSLFFSSVTPGARDETKEHRTWSELSHSKLASVMGQGQPYNYVAQLNINKAEYY